MSERTQALPAAALVLDPGERRWLAGALWDSFDEDEEILSPARERLAEIQSGAVRWLTHDEVMASLKK